MQKLPSHAGFAHRPSTVDCGNYLFEGAVVTNPAQDTSNSSSGSPEYIR